MLDADIAGCVTTWLSNNGQLDETRRGWLEGSLRDLARVLPPLEQPEERAYYERLDSLGRLVLA